MSRVPASFFGQAARGFRGAVATKYRPYLLLFRRVVRFASDLLNSAFIPRDDQQKLLVAILLGRLIEGTQAGVELGRSGFRNDAAVLIRVAFESYIHLAACAREASFCREYVNSDLVRRLKLTRGALQMPKLSSRRREQYLAQEMKLAADVAKVNARAVSLEATARRLSKTAEYQTIYRLTSGSVHVSTRSLEEYVTIRRGRITGLTFGPSDKDLSRTFLTLAEYLLRGAGEFGNLFQIDRSGQWNRIYSDLRSLARGA